MFDSVAVQVPAPVVRTNTPRILPVGASLATRFRGTLMLLPDVLVMTNELAAMSLADDAQKYSIWSVPAPPTLDRLMSISRFEAVR